MLNTFARVLGCCVVALCLTSCQETTQVTFDIKTDIPCDRLNGVAITVGLDGQTEKNDPRDVVRECRPDGTVGIIGTYALVPKADKNVLASIKVAAAVGDDIDVTTDCTLANKYAGCVVARRQISFLRNRNLTIPIELYLICRSVACDDTSTCNKAGRCVPSRIDETKCEASGTCSAFLTKPGDGLPCFNDGTAEPLFCLGDDGWCTRDENGQRACTEAPGTTGVSFECREDKDCGPGLECLSGEGGVLGKCHLVTTTGAPATLTGVTITDPSPTNRAQLTLSYAGFTGTMEQFCVLENSSVVRNCNWVSASAPPSRYTPNLVSGPLVLTVFLKSHGGVISGSAISNTVVVDRVAPQVSFISPAGGESWPNSASQQVQFMATDDRPLPTTPLGLEVSSDDGTIWAPVASSLPNAPYQWTLGVFNSAKMRLRLTLTDAAGNASTVISNRFTAGTPNLTIDSLQVNQGAVTTNNPALQLTWGQVSGAFTKYCININDVQQGSCSWVTASMLPATLAVTLPDGAITLTAWVQGADGTVSAPVSSNSIVLDQTAPVAAWVSPAGNEVWNGSAHQLTWTATDTIGLAALPVVIELSTDNGATFAPLAAARANTPSTFTWLPTASAAQAKVRLVVTDAAGNVTRVTSNTFTVDTVTPSLASLQLNAGAPATNNPLFTLTFGTVTDAFTSYCLNVNDTDVANCLWVTASTLPTTYSIGGADGSKTLTVWLRDAAGNTSAAVSSNALVLDRVMPTVSVVAPVMGATFAAGRPTALTWSASDPAPGLLSTRPIVLEFSINNGNSFTTLTGPLDNAPSSYSWVTVGINSAQVKFRVTATDAAGNTAQATSDTFTVTPVAPTLASLQVNAGATVTNSATLNLTWGATNSTFNKYCINLNDNVVANCTWVNGFTLPTTFVVPAGDGFKTLTAWVQNSVGATSTAVTANTIALDQTPPVATLVSPVDGQLWSSNNANLIRWTASDTRALATLPILLERSVDNGATFTALSAPLAATPASFSWTEPTRTSTEVKLRLTVTDAAGNTTVVTTGAFSLTPLVWAPNPRDFGSVNIFTVSGQPIFTLTNTDVTAVSGCAAPTLSNNADFQIVADTCGTNTLAPNGSCTVKVRANPQATGVRSTTLSRNCGNAGTATTPLTVTGTGTFPVKWQVTTQNLGEVNIGKSSLVNDMYFQNVGTAVSPTCTAVTLSNTTDFSIVTDGCSATTLASGDMCRVQVRATPQTAGAKTATLTRTCGGVGVATTLNASGTTAYPTQLSGGASSMCARMSDGTVRCWGNNFFGALGNSASGDGTDSDLPVKVTVLSTAVQVASGGNFNCALLADSTVQCWGLGGGLQSVSPSPVSFPSMTGAVSIAASNGTLCGVWPDTTVKCLGNNSNGQLGDGTTTSRNTAAPVTGLTGVRSVAPGDFHTCVVMTDDTMKCWGDNGTGGLGVPGGAAGSSLVPVVVPGVSGVVGATANTFGTCAWLNNQTARCWGINNFGQNGWGATAGPAVVGLSTVVSMAGSNSYGSTNCALLANGTVNCFGQNSFSGIGDGTFTQRNAPVVVPGVSGATAIAGSGNRMYCALLADHSVKCWGRQGAGVKLVPFQHPTLTNVTAVSAASDTTCALMQNNTAQCWGSGGLGDGSTGSRLTPGPVTLPGTIIDVHAGNTQSCARLTDTTLRCWSGSLPTEPSGLGSTLSFSVGSTHTCAVKTDGTVWCWGQNGYGQLGDGTTTARAAPTLVPGVQGAVEVAAGHISTCARLADGTLKCWGRFTTNGFTAESVPGEVHTPMAIAGISNATAIAVGFQMQCALLSDQTVSCFGDVVPTPTLIPQNIAGVSGATAIAAANATTCALLSDQTVKCWSINAYGLTGNLSGTAGNGSTVTNYVAQVVPGLTNVSSLRAHGYGLTMCAIRQPGGVPWCWGDNRTAQSGDATTFLRTISGF